MGLKQHTEDRTELEQKALHHMQWHPMHIRIVSHRDPPQIIKKQQPRTPSKTEVSVPSNVIELLDEAVGLWQVMTPMICLYWVMERLQVALMVLQHPSSFHLLRSCFPVSFATKMSLLPAAPSQRMLILHQRPTPWCDTTFIPGHCSAQLSSCCARRPWKVQCHFVLKCPLSKPGKTTLNCITKTTKQMNKKLGSSQVHLLL